MKIFSNCRRIIRKLSNRAKKRTPVFNKVTVIKYDGLGDFILFLDIAKDFKKIFHGMKIVLTCSPEASIIANTTNYFDEIITFTKEEFQYNRLSKTAKKASALDCEILLHPTVSRDYYSEILASFVNAHTKYSVYHEYSFPIEEHLWFEKQYNCIFDVGKYKMALQQNASFVKQLGYSDFNSKVPQIELNQKFHICLPKEYFILFVGGSKFDKIWPQERFCEMAKWLIEQTKFECVVCGLSIDKYQEEYFSKQGLDFVSYLGKTTIPELMHIVSKAKFVFGNDTSTIHMAAALSVPSICIRSAVSKTRFYPYDIDITGDENILPVAIGVNPSCEGCALDGEFRSCRATPIIEEKMNCISLVTVDMVKTEMKTFLERRKFI